MKTIDAKQFKSLLVKQNPNFSSRTEGYIVVNSLDAEDFQKEHIPNSLNVPQDNLSQLQKSFDKQKRIIVYCASHECDSSLKAARKLEEMGFTNVEDFEGGMKAWKDAGGSVETGDKQPQIEAAA